VSFLIAILRREQVAQIRGAPIFVITDVALIPLSSQKEAKKAIDQAKQGLKKRAEGHATSEEDSETSEGEEAHADNEGAEHDGQVSPESLGSSPKDDPSGSRPEGPDRSTGNVVEDVIGKQGQYGRFAERWFSRKGWTTDKRRTQGMSTAEEKPQSANNIHALRSPGAGNAGEEVPGDGDSNDQTTKRDEQKVPEESHPPDTQNANVVNTLLPKLLRTTRMLLGSRSFFFSYELDITRRMGSQNAKNSELPLHKSVDPLVSWGMSLS
jgi:hypothetical protein